MGGIRYVVTDYCSTLTVVSKPSFDQKVVLYALERGCLLGMPD